MQKGSILIFVLVGILVLSGVAGGTYYLGRSATPKPFPTPVVISQTPKPTPGILANDQTIEIPTPKTWLKYQPTCKSLADNIEIYYPDNWIPKEFGNIGDTLNPEAQECQVIFGYPVQSQSYQAPTPSEIAWFKIQSFINKEESLDKRIQAISNQDPKAKSVTKITINGITWSKVDYDKYATWVSTKINDRFIEVYLINNHSYIGEKFDRLVTLSNTDSLNSEILKKMKILQH